ncbi:phosphotransferase [Rhizobium panacihumi]|uniref:phosphotransferase n=1 Tax=Rhizobium panacihumi TaxID=2008450 RepID=UPI003D7A8900
MQIFDEADDLIVEMLPGGVSSNVLKISTGKRTFCLKQALPKLKVAKDWQAPVDRIFSEIDWLKTVDGIAPGSVPKIYGVDRASGCFAMQFLPAADYPNWKTQLLEGHVDENIAAALGNTLGRIHAATADRADMAEAFANDANFESLRLDPYLGETARIHPNLAERITAVLERTRQCKRTLVHGDVSPKNILVGRDGPVILDAECAWYGDPAFDLAFCLNHFWLKSALFPNRADGYMRLFRRMAEAYFAHVSWEPRANLDMRVATLLPCLTLARVDGKSPVEYLDENQRMQVRRLATRLIDDGLPSLEDLQAAWMKERQQ